MLARVRLDPRSPAVRSLLDAPSPATLAVTTQAGLPLSSPVWYRLAGDAIEIVMAAGDAKLTHLQRDPTCQLLIFEAARPFRGMRVRARATIASDEGARTRLAIASRYLGAADGRRYADPSRRPAGFVVRIPLGEARAWDLSDTLP